MTLPAVTADVSGGMLNPAVTHRLCNFLVVAIHTILHLHEVYPQRMFGMRNFEGLSVFLCRHPEVMDYISRTVSGLRDWISKREVESVTIVVFRLKSRLVVARYVYDLDLEAESADDTDITIRLHNNAGENEGTSNITETDLASLDAQIRAHITRLMATTGYDMSTITNEYNATSDVAQGNIDNSDEKSFDILVATSGIIPANDWTPADGAERWPLKDPVATPIKDADPFSTTASISCRIEVAMDVKDGSEKFDKDVLD